jgi:hypothetical protein
MSQASAAFSNSEQISAWGIFTGAQGLLVPPASDIDHSVAHQGFGVAMLHRSECSNRVRSTASWWAWSAASRSWRSPSLRYLSESDTPRPCSQPARSGCPSGVRSTASCFLCSEVSSPGCPQASDIGDWVTHQDFAVGLLDQGGLLEWDPLPPDMFTVKPQGLGGPQASGICQWVTHQDFAVGLLDQGAQLKWDPLPPDMSTVKPQGLGAPPASDIGSWVTHQDFAVGLHSLHQQGAHLKWGPPLPTAAGPEYPDALQVSVLWAVGSLVLFLDFSSPSNTLSLAVHNPNYDLTSKFTSLSVSVQPSLSESPVLVSKNPFGSSQYNQCNASYKLTVLASSDAAAVFSRGIIVALLRSAPNTSMGPSQTIPMSCF